MTYSVHCSFWLLMELYSACKIKIKNKKERKKNRLSGCIINSNSAPRPSSHNLITHSGAMSAVSCKNGSIRDLQPLQRDVDPADDPGRPLSELNSLSLQTHPSIKRRLSPGAINRRARRLSMEGPRNRSVNE